ncbi:hypothetical protein [Nitratifractor sp.]|uniref:hypothetical protein n=1 Tax=Nitratifractor sp. TaxID=2268144 RepID=UPI0025D50383|nr:hypothetical protein [Nitratifractor sp.]
MQDLFQNYAHLIVFIHVLGAIIWIGGMIAVRVAVHPVMQSIEDPGIKLGKTLEITARLFNLVMIFVILIVVTGLIMAIALGGHQGPDKAIFIFKEIIWTVMALNYTYMYIKRIRAQRRFNAGDLAGAKALVANIPNLLLPINIALGLVAVWLGISLRGF